MAKRKAQFRVGDRVEFTSAAAGGCATGKVLDVHRLGGYGVHYVIEPDAQFEGLGVEEVPAAYVRTLPLLERLAEASEGEPD